MDLVGDIVVPCELPGGGFASVRIGRLELPRPFQPEDLETLRKGSDALRILLASEGIGVGRLGMTTGALTAASVSGFDIRALLDLEPAASAMRSWPRRRSRTTIRHPAEIIRGVLDEPRTYREAAAGKVRIIDGQPAKTVRHVVSPAPWRSRRLADLLVEASRELDGAEVFPRLAEELRHIADVSRPKSRRPDVSRSAWPLRFRVLWDAALALLTAPRRAPGQGTDVQPLQPAWSLYQDWVAAVVVESLRDELGPFTLGGARSPHQRLRPKSERPLLGWATAASVIDVWVTPTIGRKGSPSHLEDVFGAGLAPDLLLVKRGRGAIGPHGHSPHEEVGTVVVDAKRYVGTEEAPGVLSRGTVATMASKYLWALRSPDNAERHQLDLVALVSPGGSDFQESAPARTTVLAGRPRYEDQVRQFTLEMMLD